MAIEQAFEKMKERVKRAGGVLDPNSNANGRVLRAYIDSKGLDFNALDDDALAAALYEAVTVEATRLKWLKLPPKVAKFADKGIAKVPSNLDTSFADKVRQDEADKANAKAESKAEKTTLGIIASFRLDSIRKTEDCQARLRARVARYRKSGFSWAEIAKDIYDRSNALYAAAEREVEQVGVYRSLLDEVEV